MIRNIKPLQTRGYVETTKVRGKVFTLTPEGEHVLELAIPIWERTQAKIQEALGDDDVQTLLRISEKLQEIGRCSTVAPLSLMPYFSILLTSSPAR